MQPPVARTGYRQVVDAFLRQQAMSIRSGNVHTNGTSLFAYGCELARWVYADIDEDEDGNPVFRGHEQPFLLRTTDARLLRGTAVHSDSEREAHIQAMLDRVRDIVTDAAVTAKVDFDRVDSFD